MKGYVSVLIQKGNEQHKRKFAVVRRKRKKGYWKTQLSESTNDPRRRRTACHRKPFFTINLLTRQASLENQTKQVEHPHLVNNPKLGTPRQLIAYRSTIEKVRGVKEGQREVFGWVSGCDDGRSILSLMFLGTKTRLKNKKEIEGSFACSRTEKYIQKNKNEILWVSRGCARKANKGEQSTRTRLGWS